MRMLDLLALPCLLLTALLAHAEDLAGAKDHPLLSRYPDSHITEYQQYFNAVEFATGSQDGVPQRHSIEGNATPRRSSTSTTTRRSSRAHCS